MILRDGLTRYLAGIYDYNIKDWCENGLQVEGKDRIERVVFGVSFNLSFLERAVAKKADAIIVHHGIFQEGVFKIKDGLKARIKLLMDHDISLYGIHLPMDIHRDIGHNAQLLSFIGAEEVEAFEVGFMGNNAKNHTLDEILEIYHCLLHPGSQEVDKREHENSAFFLSRKYGFAVLRNGPATPKKVAVVTGDSAGYYEQAIEAGADTFFGGNIKEHTPAASLESRTNFINLGHYYSEKPGIISLQKRIEADFDVQTEYIEIENPI
ncbi:MAG: Nif3-like dinuclear metal center hexameric protein [bacterium]|nr:Nif3-like dinuclear metal center hexameric protein [bacterium]